jgi:hypothetical protein
VGSSNRNSVRSRSALSVAAAAIAVLALVGCASGPAPERATVTPANAYTAIVEWEIERTEPVSDADGNVEVPVIYLAAGSGGTVDVRVQADVVANIDDAAVIRFVDDARDARDEKLDNEPVKNRGVMILIDEFEPDQAKVDARIVRYQSIDDDSTWILQVTSTLDSAAVSSATRVTE